MNKFEMIRRIYNDIPPDPVPEIEEIEEYKPLLGRLGKPVDRVYSCRIHGGDPEGEICDDCFIKMKEAEKNKSSLIDAGIGASIGIMLFNSAFKKNY